MPSREIKRWPRANGLDVHGSFSPLRLAVRTARLLGSLPLISTELQLVVADHTEKRMS